MRVRRLRRHGLLAAFLVMALLPAGGLLNAQEATPSASSATGFTTVKFPGPQPGCTGVGLLNSPYYDRLDCGFGYASVSETEPDSDVGYAFFGPDGEEFGERVEATYRPDDDAWQFFIRPSASWPAGEITVQATVDGDLVPGTGSFFVNALGARVSPAASENGYRPGDAVEVTGEVFEQDSVGTDTNETGVPATFALQVVTPEGEVRGPYEQVTADDDGAFEATLPAEATSGLQAGPETEYRVGLSIEVVDATYDDPVTGPWAAERAGAGAVSLQVPVDQLLLENSFTSSVGWVKPGEAYPSRLIVRNFTDAPGRNVRVTVPAVDGTTFTEARPVGGAGAATISDGAVSWEVGSVPAAEDGSPGVASLILTAEADDLVEDPQVSWKNISTVATLSYEGGPGPFEAASHGPKVIPPNSTYETARYGDRPFPVVPVDYRDRKHTVASGDDIAAVINDPDVPGSTFNLFQDMSYGQLFPEGTVPSAGIATADFGDYEFDFHETQVPTNTCTGTHGVELNGTPLNSERIVDGWYQMPGDTGYYGQDSNGTALGLGSIDAGCGDTGKSVYDAAAIADPEIDYNDFDTDKDGVVDFFMMIFVGVGGNGVSQTSVPPYDNIWPHSSNLEAGFFDPETGLSGYVSDDQLRDLEDRPLFYTDEGRTQTTTDETEFPVFVRVGPYNVNPESALDRASVISHEYGHSLGLPDYYSGSGVTGGTEFYDTWNLMAADYSQYMDVQARQELGWVVPNVLAEGDTEIRDMVDSTTNTQRIEWQTPDGEPYVLEGDGVANGEAYGTRLPAREIIPPDVVENGASLEHVWWSQSGNSFDCTPQGGHNFDIVLSQLEDVEPGTEVTLEYSSNWDIEWDFDYGFTMVTVDQGKNYVALESQQGFTTPQSQNPNTNTCQGRYGNGLTGTTGSYTNGNPEIDRLPEVGGYPPSDEFVRDSYDLSEFAGQEAVVRFSYATDVGLARPGWFIDDLVVRAGDEVLYSTEFEETGAPDDPNVYNGGCRKDLQVAANCTDGWQYVNAADGSAADHAYYFEMRDRTGFDFDGKNEGDRGPITWTPGLSLAFTDESAGYGNSQRSDRPNQHILDARPDPGVLSPNLDDAAFIDGDTFSDAGEGHVDNYTDPAREDGLFRFDFNCLNLAIVGMDGTDIGPSERPGNLTGDVDVTTGGGCAEWDYGFSGIDIDGDGEPDAPDLDTDPRGPGDGDGPGGEGPGPGPDPGETLERVFGAGRIDTAVAISQKGFPDGADTAILARASDFPDALAASPLATEVGAPVLLTPTDELAPQVAAELDRLGAENVYVLGGTDAIDASVEAEVAEDRGVQRLEGASRFDTAAEIAREIVEVGGAIDQAIVARGDDFADALSAGNLATASRAPILLTGTDELAEPTRQVLDELLSAEGVFLAGGTAAVSDEVAQELRDEGYTPKRLAGAERYGTAVAIARAAIAEGADPEPAVLASGLDFPDALAAAPLAHTLGGLLVLVDAKDLSDSPASEAFLADEAAAIDTIVVAGGPQAIADLVLDQARAATGD